LAIDAAARRTALRAALAPALDTIASAAPGAAVPANLVKEDDVRGPTLG
jgi:hypothetical protein